MTKLQKIDLFLQKKKMTWDSCNKRQKEILLKENENVWNSYVWDISNSVQRKFVETFNVNEWEIETDTGWEDVTAIGKTVEYEKWYLITENCKLECADDHIVFDDKFNEVFVKDLKVGDLIQTKNGNEKVASVYTNGEYEHMYDIEVNSNNHRYYTDDILSHNSIWLANLAAQAVKLGYNSAVISLEMRDKHVVKRLGANMLGITMQEYAKLAEDQDLIKKKLSNIGYEDLKQPGKLWVKEYPTSSASTKDIERWLLKMEQLKGIKFKTVFIDYINILMNWRNPNSENMYLKIKQIAEDMRAMGTRNNWAIITLTQINRCLTLDTLVETRKGKLRIDKLIEGDEILTPEGFAPVTKIYPKEKQKVYKIITKSGKEIKVSERHLTPKSDGTLCTVNELKIGDKILSKSEKCV